MIYMHPNSVGLNVVKLFPEIYEKYEPIKFLLPGFRYGDFISSSIFIFGSQKTQDISMIFSAVQRLYNEKHMSFRDFVVGAKRYEILVNQGKKSLLQNFDRIWEEYNQEYSMRKVVHKFYKDWLTDEEKTKITSRMAIQASYKLSKRKNLDTSLILRLDILIDWRNDHDHRAEYTPFSNGERYSEHELKYNKKFYKLLNKLTFQEFYELTRKAMSRFWRSEYEAYLKVGGKEKINAVIEEVMKQTNELNERKEKVRT